MVLDINLFRKDKGGDPDIIKESQRRRFADETLVDKVIELDEQWKKKRFALDEKQKEYTQLSKQIGSKMKLKQNVDEEKAKVKAVKEEISKLEDEVTESDKKRNATLALIGNIVHQSVPVSRDENKNEIVKEWGEFKTREGLRHHHELLWMIGGYDPDRGVKTAGHRAYYLTGPGFFLNQALINYGVHLLTKQHKYTAVQTPFFMNQDAMAAVAQLSQFDEELYKVTGEDEKYLIATSEQPIAALHRDEWLDLASLPIRYVGYSTCFRKEAGAHGKDTWGIFRVHQFEKIEQFCITSPEKSWEEHEAMLKRSEEFYESLGIPYRVVTIVSGELNNAAAKKYDLEGWFPSFGEHRELVSCSNCTDYQARRLEVRCGQSKKKGQAKQYVHMLNSTLCATTRTICAILENYQSENGILVPKVLQPYLAPFLENPEIIPYVNPPPPKGKGASKGGPEEKGAAKPKQDKGAAKPKGAANPKGGAKQKAAAKPKDAAKPDQEKDKNAAKPKDEAKPDQEKDAAKPKDESVEKGAKEIQNN
eukprot:TRINITY_DN161_c0_g1_i4.p1 TRINITY_DN161_c0_g1~~TRINITY_DN161_c0_g1_i4.p1  ORF type:complete len:534 (-),score=131.47 TRINITY_DN161_c0_g1_i4:47-1648(-)